MNGSQNGTAVIVIAGVEKDAEREVAGALGLDQRTSR